MREGQMEQRHSSGDESPTDITSPHITECGIASQVTQPPPIVDHIKFVLDPRRVVEIGEDDKGTYDFLGLRLRMHPRSGSN